MFARVVVAVDDTESGRRAIAVAHGLAASNDAALDVVVVDPPDDDRSTEAVARSVLDSAVVDPCDVDHEFHALEEQSPAAVESVAASRDADVVVVGRSGPTGVSERLLGDTTDGVLRATDRPTVVVPAAATVDPSATYANVLAPTDGSDTAVAAPWAGRLAASLGATLHVVRVLDLSTEASAFDAGGATEEYLETLESERREDVSAFRTAAESVTEDLRTEGTVRRGHPHEEVADHAEEVDAALVVLATSNAASLTGRLFGSDTARILDAVAVPTVVIPENVAGAPP